MRHNDKAIIKGRVSLNDFFYDRIVEAIDPAYTDSKECISQAIAHHKANKLSYDCDTGIVRDRNTPVLPRHTIAADYQYMDDILIVEFIPYINNSISRLIRGYDVGF